MDKIILTDCYLPVVVEQLPDIIFSPFKGGERWLEKKSGMIVLTVEQFEKIAGDAFEAGGDKGRNPHSSKPNKTEYITTLLK